VLVGREAEQRVLDALVAGARLGRSGVLLVVGEPGIGKTTLLDYVADRADEMTLVRVAGAEAERDLPFGALALALGPTLSDVDLLPGPQAAALRTALALDAGTPPDRFAVGAATLGVLTRRAEQRPLALVLDDAHHLDRPSAEALVFAARRLVADPILVVAALRDGEPSPLRSADLPELALTGLDEAGTADLLQSADPAPGTPVVAGATGRAAWVHRATGGNPLAIVELARGMAGTEIDSLGADAAVPVPVPAALADGFVRRARAVGPEATTLLALVEAAAGDLRVVLGAEPALDLDPGVLARTEAAGLVRTTADRVAFTHPLVGSSAYASLTPNRQRAVHAAVVAALPRHDTARRAWHAAAAALGPDEVAAGALEQVGVEARGRGAYAVAASALERSAQLTDDDVIRADRGVAAAAAAFDAGDHAWALRLLDDVVAGAVPLVTRTRAGALRGAITTRSGALDDAWAILVAAAREVADNDPNRALHLVADAASVAFYLADGDVARESRGLAESLLDRGVGDSAAGIGRLAVGMAQVLDGRDGADQIREGFRLLGGEHARPTDEVDATWLLIGALFLREEGWSRRLLRAVEEARADTSVGGLPHLLFHLARDEATTDRWPAAVSDYAEATALAEELGQTTEEAMSLAGLAWLEARRGNADAARQHAVRAVALAEPRRVVIATVWAEFALGDLELGAGRMPEALDRYASLLARLGRERIRDVDLSPAPELAEVLLRTGGVERAAEVAAEHRRQAERKGQPWSLARAWRTTGLLADDDGIDAAFGTARRLHAETPDTFEAARTDLAYGSRLRRARRRVDARVRLGAAYQAFERLGARPWAATAADELAATGVTVAPHGATGLELLTPRERQIVQLLVDGRTTREAAGALFLSPKTVEYHLRHVYTKLGITSRRELADVVRSGG
jgi:DNA-binding CsgD family transcriptional regulator/tetratricopeptide (TPR) repeat protein